MPDETDALLDFVEANLDMVTQRLHDLEKAARKALAELDQTADYAHLQDAWRGWQEARGTLREVLRRA